MYSYVVTYEKNIDVSRLLLCWWNRKDNKIFKR